MTNSEIDQLLANTAKDAERDSEITRVLQCHNSDAFSILELDPKADLATLDSKVKKAFRQKSLLIHPDKTNNTDAPAAFDLLKKAQAILSAPTVSSVAVEGEKGPGDQAANEKQKLIDIYNLVYTEESTPDKIRKRVAEILDSEAKEAEELVRQQKNEEVKEHEQVESRKSQLEAKRQFETKWEEQRDTRVNSWRTFSKVEKKKKKSKKKVLA